MDKVQLSRRGFLAGAASLAAAATGSVRQVETLLTSPSLRPTLAQAVNAYEWLSVHLEECQLNAGGYLSSAIADNVRLISDHLTHQKLENPLLQHVKAADRLRTIDPETALPNAPRSDYGWNSKSEEATIIRGIEKSIRKTAGIMEQMSAAELIRSEKEKAFAAQRSLVVPAASENSIVFQETPSSQFIETRTPSPSSIQIDFDSVMRIVEKKEAVPSGAITDDKKAQVSAPSALPAPKAPAP